VPKYLIEATYTAEGLKGLIRDKASGRSAAAKKAAESLGGKAEAVYFTFGESDVIVIADFPDNVSAAALAIAVSASGMLHIKTTPLLTVEEVDQAVSKSVQYKPPGK
jgi:uncharacterized protein with GYD domain